MYSFNSIRNVLLYQKALVVLCLSGAVWAAYNVGNLLSWAGIIYYLICALAVLRNHRWARILLWSAVGIHSILIGYSLWQWNYFHIEPCPYCFAAAGLVLTAAVGQTRFPVVVLPAMLMLGVGLSWSRIYASPNNLQFNPPSEVQMKNNSNLQKAASTVKSSENNSLSMPGEKQSTNLNNAKTVSKQNDPKQALKPGPVVIQDNPAQPQQNAEPSQNTLATNPTTETTLQENSTEPLPKPKSGG